MAQALTATSVNIRSYSAGGNRRPMSGDAQFSDGKWYSFFWHPIDHYWVFTASRKVDSRMQNFQSDKRAKALEAAFDSGANVADKSVLRVQL